jgi:long-chain acyl-CoA synthetase
MKQEVKLSHIKSAWKKGPRFPLGVVPLHEYLREWAKRQPDKDALIYYGKRFTYKELDQIVDRFATALHNLGVRKGDRVTVFLPNCPQYLLSYFALQRIGAVLVSANPMYKRIELGEAMKSTDSRDIICLDQLYRVVSKIRGEIKLRNVILTSYLDFLPKKPELPIDKDMASPKQNLKETLDFLDLLQQYEPEPPKVEIRAEEDPSIILFTGGTTGRPKPCVHTFFNQTYKAPVIPEFMRKVGVDLNTHTILLFLPVFHRMAQIQADAYLYSGATVVLLTRFNPVPVLEAVQKYKCTTVGPVVAPVLEALMRHPDVEKYDLSSLGRGVSTAQTFDTPFPEEYIEKWKRLTGIGLGAGAYGLTETMSRDTMPRLGEMLPINAPVDLSFMGLPIYDTEIKIVNPETVEIVPEGDTGEIMIKSPTLMKGYYKMPEETARQITEDGWLYTGDLGKVGSDGFLYHKGRTKEMIKRSGWSIFPSEVEDIMRMHPAIENAVLIGVPDCHVGEELKAIVELNPEYGEKITDQELIKWCKENMSSYKYPRIIEFRTIPFDMVGKTARKTLKEQEEKSREK